jgi:ankyrin repeat protein
VEAVYSHDFDLMSQYAEQGANIDIRHRGYDHLMHYYAAKDDIDGVRWCINHHMDVNQLDSLGATPLIHATCDGYSTICKLLIDNGANTQIKSSYGMAASEYAAHNSFPALSAYIINPTTVVPHDFYNYR